jgi:type 1 fimbriae regulatory protein FimB
LDRKYLTEAEVEALFRAIESPRDRAIFRLVYHRGLRRGEVGLLQLSDFNRVSGRLYVRRLKGSNSAEFPLLPAELAPLRAWLRVRGTAPGPLFPSRQRGGIGGDRLDDLMKAYGRAAGLPEQLCHCHALKHSCGTHVLARAKDLQLVKDHLGHKSIQNTEIYAQWSGREDAVNVLRDWGKSK